MGYGGLMVGAAAPSLVSRGLTADADLVYRTLLSYGDSTAADLARALGMTRRRVDTALADLLAARAVVHYGSHPSWRAEPVDQVTQRLRHRQVRRTAAPVPVPRLPASEETVELGPGIRHLRNRELTRLRLAALVQQARHESLTLNPEASFDPAAMRAAAPTDRALVSRGVSIRIIGALPRDPDRLVPYGGEANPSRKAYREVPQVPMKLIVIDRQVALFPVDPGDYERGYLEVAQAPIVSSLVETFEKCWTNATDPLENTMPTFALSPREELLISLLVHGHTDTTAAREMQISERSVSNMLRSLMDRLRVENRFQLGVALGALRAAPVPPGLTALTAPQE